MLDSIQAHAREARFDSRVRAQKRFFSEQALGFDRAQEIDKDSRRSGVKSLLGYPDRMNAEDDRIGIGRPVDRRSS